MKLFFTIGYEARTVDERSKRLDANWVGSAVDVRALPLSQKGGFSKRALANTLEGVGIAYIHRIAPGTPKWMRKRCKRDHDFGAFKKRHSTSISRTRPIRCWN